MVIKYIHLNKDKANYTYKGIKVSTVGLGYNTNLTFDFTDKSFTYSSFSIKHYVSIGNSNVLLIHAFRQFVPSIFLIRLS